MGFNKRFVPPYAVLVKEIETLDSKMVIDRYLNADALIGPSDSMDLLNAFIYEYKKGASTLGKSFIERFEKQTK